MHNSLEERGNKKRGKTWRARWRTRGEKCQESKVLKERWRSRWVDRILQLWFSFLLLHHHHLLGFGCYWRFELLDGWFVHDSVDSSHSLANGRRLKFRNKRCCCHRKAEVIISESLNNQDRLFFRCRTNQCGFFEW